jgi:hypothetical protein
LPDPGVAREANGGSDRPARRPAWTWNRRTLLWLAPSLALILLQLRPVLTRLDSTVLGTLTGTDALMQSGILTWSAAQWWRPAAWVELPIVYPVQNALVCMDTLLGQALLVGPWRLLGASPALLYNLACAATLGLLVLAGSLLWRATAEDPDHRTTAIGAGLCALFLLGSPFTAWNLGMLNQISPPWVVFHLACLWLGWRRFQVQGRAGWWWWAAAACLVIQVAWGWYGFAAAVFGLMVAGSVAVVLGWRGRRLRSFLNQSVPPALLALAAVMVLAWPYLAQRADQPEFTRGMAEVRTYSTSLQMIGNPGPHRATWDDLLGRSEPAAARALRNDGAVLYPGWLTLLGALLAAMQWRRLSPAQRRYGLVLAAIALVGAVMSFGESGGLPPGSEQRLKLPFGYLREIAPPFQAFRAPVRFVYLIVIAMAWWATLGFLVLAERWGRRRGRWLLIGVMAAVLIESIPMGLLAVPTQVDGRIRRHPLPEVVPPGAVLTLPAPATEAEEDLTEVRWLHRALATGRHVTGGVSGWVPLPTRDLRLQLAACEAGRADPLALLDRLRGEGIAGVELAVTAGQPERVAFWEAVLIGAGYRPLPTVPGYRFYLPPS